MSYIMVLYFQILFSQNRDEKTAEPLTLERIYIKNPKKLTEEELTDVFQVNEINMMLI